MQSKGGWNAARRATRLHFRSNSLPELISSDRKRGDHGSPWQRPVAVGAF
jgi:hypothetical protein